MSFSADFFAGIATFNSEKNAQKAVRDMMSSSRTRFDVYYDNRHKVVIYSTDTAWNEMLLKNGYNEGDIVNQPPVLNVVELAVSVKK